MSDKAFIYVLMAIALLILAGNVRQGRYMEKRRSRFYAAAVLSNAMVLLGYTGREIAEGSGNYALGIISALSIYIFSVLIPYFLVYPVAEERKGICGILICLEAVHFFLTVSSSFTGLLFRVSITGQYSRGSLFYLNYIWGSALYILWVILSFFELAWVDRKDKARIYGTFLLVLASSVLQMVHGENMLVYIGSALALMIFYSIIVETEGKYDYLTRVYSLRYYVNFRDVFIRGGDYSLIALDANGLKILNDNMGHNMGTRLLIEVAHGIAEAVGDSGKVFRTGGDEFAVIVNARDEELVRQIIERTKAIYKEREKDTGFEISVSFGMALPESGEAYEAVARRADADMYREKNEYYSQPGRERRRG